MKYALRNTRPLDEISISETILPVMIYRRSQKINEVGGRVTVKDHYDNFLAKYYSWMFGDFEAKVQENINFFKKHHILPAMSGRAVDLGCGSGFQSIALSGLGFSVLSIDQSSILLEELEQRRGLREIEIVRDDILCLRDHLSDQVDLITCMGDTLTHLDSLSKIEKLFRTVYMSLKAGGRLCLTFRDMTEELQGIDRIIPVRADDHLIMTCFLEYEGQYVNVHDIIYVRTQTGWELNKSFYKKIRVGVGWVKKELEKSGFHIVFEGTTKGFSAIVASK
jgi:SAM-dependent methyltransferase